MTVIVSNTNNIFLLLLLLPVVSQAVRISVIKYWSAAVSESDTAKLACKANTGAEIK